MSSSSSASTSAATARSRIASDGFPASASAPSRPLTAIVPYSAAHAPSAVSTTILSRPWRSRPDANASPIRRTERSISTCWRRSSCIWALRRSLILLNSLARPAISSSPTTGTLRLKSPSPIPRAASSIARTWPPSMRRSMVTKTRATAKNTHQGGAMTTGLEEKKPPELHRAEQGEPEVAGTGQVGAPGPQALSAQPRRRSESPLDGRLAPSRARVDETVPPSIEQRPVESGQVADPVEVVGRGRGRGGQRAQAAAWIGEIEL